MFRHEFRRTPLSAAVPLEGSDTVVGLRELENRQRREALQSLFGAANGVPVAQRSAAGKCEVEKMLTSSALLLVYTLLLFQHKRTPFGCSCSACFIL